MTLGRDRFAWRLDARTGWRPGPRDPRVDLDGPLTLRHIPGGGRPLVDGTGGFGGLADVTGLAIDADGVVYALDAATPALFRFDPCEGWERLACVVGGGSGVGELRDPGGLAVTPWGDLWVADTGNNRVQVFSTHGWRVRHILGPEVLGVSGGPDWEPVDVAVCPRGRVYVSDHAGDAIVVFDRHGRVHQALRGSAEVPLSAPTHLAIDRCGRVHVVLEGDDAVTVLDTDGEPVERVTTDDQVRGRFCPGALAVDESGRVIVADRQAGHLVIFGAPTGRTRWRPTVTCQPCGLDALAVTRDGRPLVARSRGPRVEELDLAVALEPTGWFVSTALDSTLHACQWHRVRLRATLPGGCRVWVRTLTSETRKDDDEVVSLPDSRWSPAVLLRAHEDLGDWDCLVRSGEGRYLWLRLDLEGPGTATPSVDVATVTYPRQTSTDYLPGVYRDDPGGDDFLERFLGVFDRTFADLVVATDALPALADPLATPAREEGGPEFLTWLASWLDVELDRSWPLAARRQLVAEASWLFANRGTVTGLRRHIELYLGFAPRILEHFRLRRWLHVDEGRLGDSSKLWGDAIVNRLQLDAHAPLDGAKLIDTHDPLRDPLWVHAHSFTVFVPGLNADDGRRRALERIVELSKPSHTRADLRDVSPRLRVGDAMVGLDSVVACYPSRTVTGQSRLSHDSVLGPEPDPPRRPSLEVGGIRLGNDAVID